MGTGNRGRFSERLKRIAFWKKKRNDIEEDDYKNTGGLKRFFLIPLMFIQKKVDNSSKKVISEKKKDEIIDKEQIQFKLEKLKNEALKNNELDNEFVDENNLIVNTSDENKNDKLKVQNIRNIDVVLLRKIHDENLKKYNDSNQLSVGNKEDQFAYHKSVNLKKEQLEREILNLLKKELVKQLNEFEILQSDLYILKEIENNDILYNRCNENIVEVKKILSKIKSLKEKYDYLKDNVDFEYMLEVKNEPLYDKIIDLKNTLETDKIPFLVDDYKLLEEYKFLYLKIDKFKEDAIKYEEEKNKKALELKKRDIDFEKFKNNINNVSSLSNGYEKFVKEQNEMMKALNEKVDKIDEIHKVTYSYKGFGTLLGHSFKYLGLLLMNPFKGFFPNIAIQTLATRRIIHDLSDSLKLEEKKFTVYEAVDYSREIDTALYDIDYTTSLIDNSLDDIVKLKRTFKEKFEKYNGNFSDYRDAIKKLNKIENTILNNKVKIGLIKEKMLEQEKINSQKMAKVLKLNENNK